MAEYIVDEKERIVRLSRSLEWDFYQKLSAYWSVFSNQYMFLYDLKSFDIASNMVENKTQEKNNMVNVL